MSVPRPERDGGKLPRGVRRWDVLAKYIVLGKSQAAIADDYDTSFASVGDCVRDLANRLGIALKPNEKR